MDVPPLDLQGMREEGEGMETTETESLSSSSTPLASLEQLLTSADLKHGTVTPAHLWSLAHDSLEKCVCHQAFMAHIVISSENTYGEKQLNI